jgi:hypothetical protein
VQLIFLGGAAPFGFKGAGFDSLFLQTGGAETMGGIYAADFFLGGVPHPSVSRVRVLTLSVSANGIDLNSHVPAPS